MFLGRKWIACSSPICTLAAVAPARAIARPMPLAAAVMTATLSQRVSMVRAVDVVSKAHQLTTTGAPGPRRE